MGDVIVFNGVTIGDEGKLLVPTVEALVRGVDGALWSTFAGVEDGSRNWVWRVRAAVLVVRNADWKVIEYVGSLRAALGGVKAELEWKTGSVVRVRWGEARLDVIRPPKRYEQKWAGFEANVVVEFVAAQDPTA